MKELSTKKSVYLTVLATAASKLIILAALGYPARVLGPESFGIVVTAASITAYMGVLLWPGMSNWGAMEIARNPHRGDEIVSTILIIRTALALFGLLAISLVIYASGLSPLEKQAIVINSLILLSLAINTDWVFYGKELSHYPASASMVSSVINVALIFSLINSSRDTLIYISLLPAISLLYSCILLIKLLQCNIKLFLPKLVVCVSALRHSSHLGFSGVMIVLLQYSTHLFVRANLDSESTGIFGAGFYLFQLTMLIPATINTIVMGRFARIFSKFPGRIGEEANNYFALYVIGGLVCAFLTYCLSPSVVALVYGEWYKQSAELLRIMSVGIFFNFSIAAAVGFLSALDKGRAVLATVTVSLATTVAGGIILVPMLGLKGAAITVSIIDMGGLFVAVKFLKSYIPKFKILTYAYPISATLFSVLALDVLHNYFSDLVSIVLGMVLQFLLLVIPLRSVTLKILRQDH